MDIKIHNFKKTGKGLCGICGKKILVSGLYCTKCKMNIHSSCIDKCVEECLDTRTLVACVTEYDETAKEERAHLISSIKFPWNTHCNVCAEVIQSQTKCFVCHICGIIFHENCEDTIHIKCKPKHTNSHYLIKGNCKGTCCVCQKPVGNNSLLIDFRCTICHRLVHSECISQLNPCLSSFPLYNVISEPLLYPFIIISSTIDQETEFAWRFLNESRQLFSPEQVFDIQYGITPVISYIKKYPKGLLICALNTIDFNRLIETIVLEKAQRRVILLPNGVDSDISMQYGWTMDTLSKPRQFYSTIPKAMFTSLDIWGNDQHFFKQWLCFGFNSISSTIFPLRW